MGMFRWEAPGCQVVGWRASPGAAGRGCTLVIEGLLGGTVLQKQPEFNGTVALRIRCRPACVFFLTARWHIRT